MQPLDDQQLGVLIHRGISTGLIDAFELRDGVVSMCFGDKSVCLAPDRARIFLRGVLLLSETGSSASRRNVPRSPESDRLAS